MERGMIENSILGKLTQETRNVVTNATESCRDSVKPLAETAIKAIDPSQLSDYAQRKVALAVNDFTKCLPLYERAGFTLRCLDLELGITPHLTPRFTIGTIPPQEERKKLLEDARKLGSSASAVLTALFKAVELKHFLELGNLELVGLNVTLSTIPSVRLVFE